MISNKVKNPREEEKGRGRENPMLNGTDLSTIEPVLL